VNRLSVFAVSFSVFDARRRADLPRDHLSACLVHTHCHHLVSHITVLFSLTAGVSTLSAWRQVLVTVVSCSSSSSLLCCYHVRVCSALLCYLSDCLVFVRKRPLIHF
jgi:hypothetical protein